jgi:hypothetical protein
MDDLEEHALNIHSLNIISKNFVLFGLHLAHLNDISIRGHTHKQRTFW